MSNPQEKPASNQMVMIGARLPWHDRFGEEFKDLNVNKGSWRTLCEAIWPGAKSVESIQMALSYCKARSLDPFKRPVHIVPMWSSVLRRMVETVWPGISELRTTAARTKEYGGSKPTEFGPTVKKVFYNEDKKELEVEFPEWARITVTRLVQGIPLDFPGPMVRWTETYATESRDSDWPNAMWRKRPFGQLEKCAEAASLRKAFPEEIGGEYAAEEMEGQTFHGGFVEGSAQEVEDYRASSGPPSAPPPVKGQAQVEDRREVPMDTQDERERETANLSPREMAEQDEPQAEEVPDDKRKPEPAKKASAGKKGKAAEEPVREAAAELEQGEEQDLNDPEVIFNNLLKSLRATLTQAQKLSDDRPISDWMKESLETRKALPKLFSERMKRIIAAVYNDPEGGPDIIKGI